VVLSGRSRQICPGELARRAEPVVLAGKQVPAEPHPPEDDNAATPGRRDEGPDGQVERRDERRAEHGERQACDHTEAEKRPDEEAQPPSGHCRRQDPACDRDRATRFTSSQPSINHARNSTAFPAAELVRSSAR